MFTRVSTALTRLVALLVLLSLLPTATLASAKGQSRAAQGFSPAVEGCATRYAKVVYDINQRPRFDFGDCIPSRFMGVNMPGLAFLDPWEMDEELNYAQRLGAKVVRVMAFDENTSSADMANRLRTALSKAQQRGIFLSIAITGNYLEVNSAIKYPNGQQIKSLMSVPRDNKPNDYVTDQRGFYSRACNPHWCLADSWLGWGYQAYYLPYAKDLVSRLQTETGIFSWDIANEVSGSTRNQDIVVVVANFYERMARELKASDPNHMVTTGLISTSWVGMVDAQRDQVYGSANIDYLTIHEYSDQNQNVNRWNDQFQDDEVWRANQRYKKPLVVQEIGVQRTLAQDMQSELSKQYTNRLAPVAGNAFEATGLLHWGVSHFSYYADGKYFPFAAMEVNNWFTNLMKSWADTLAWEARNVKRCTVIPMGAVLLLNDQVNSCDGRFFLKFQANGNVALFQRGANGNITLWHAGMQGKGGTRLIMQTDGNFVLYNWNAVPVKALWYTATANNPGAYLAVQNDGNLVLYSSAGKVLWKTNTCCH